MTVHLGLAGREPLDSGYGREFESAATPGGRARLPLPVMLFLIGTVIPLILQLGPLRLSSSRLVLLVMLLPCIVLWLSGRAGPIRKADICVVLICVWSSVSFFVIHGPSMIEASGMLTIEILGAYLLGRCYIRTPEQFFSLARFLFGLVALLLPFANIENVTGTDLVLRLFDLIGPVDGEVNMEPRLGLDRAQGPFAHPILFGVFCGSTLGITYFVLGHRKSFKSRVRNAVLVVWAGFAALSSGPLSAIVGQLIIISWNRIFRGVPKKWNIFGAWCIFSYVFIDVLSNRTPFVVLIDYLALNSQTGMNRIRIWNWGTKNIMDNPIFGIGFNDWERLSWMSDSVDMFWILGGMRHGIAVWILWFAAFFLITIPIGRLKNLDARVYDYRMGYLITMSGFFICGWMVDFWNEVLTLFMLILASGVWMLDYRPPSADLSIEKVMTAENRERRRTVL